MLSAGTIAAGPTQALLSALERRGANPSSVLARAGLKHGQLADIRTVVPLATFTTLLDVAAADQGKPAFGLELARGFPIEELGPIALLALSSRNVGEALANFTHYFPCMQSKTRSALAISNGTARLAYSISDPTVRFRMQDALFTLAIEYALIHRLVGRDWTCCHVDFEHSVDDGGDICKAHFSCPVRFGQRENAISFPASYLNEPVAQADGFENARIEQSLRDKMQSEEAGLDLLGGLEAWMSACLAHSVPVDIEYAASDFGMSRRTFQRKLDEHGVSYVDVRNKVRCQIGQCMLAETQLSVTEIAYSLGYSETSAFSRAFHQRIGLSPVAYRAQIRNSSTLLQ